MGKIIGKITDTFGFTNIAGQEEAGRAGQEAAEAQLGFQQKGLDYLMKEDQLPSELRRGALGQLGSIYGIGEGDQQGAIDKLRQNPMYAAIMGTQAAGEESILRNQAATGGLRTGGTQAALGQYASALERQALQSSLHGLESMTRLPSLAGQISQTTAGIGQTRGQGMMSVANADLNASNQLADVTKQLTIEAAKAFSDKSLKDNIVQTGKENGFNTYRWDWNDKAAELGLYGGACGVIAQEVVKTNPEAVSVKNGFMQVNYEMIGVKNG